MPVHRESVAGSIVMHPPAAIGVAVRLIVQPPAGPLSACVQPAGEGAAVPLWCAMGSDPVLAATVPRLQTDMSKCVPFQHGLPSVKSTCPAHAASIPPVANGVHCGPAAQ